MGQQAKYGLRLQASKADPYQHIFVGSGQPELHRSASTPSRLPAITEDGITHLPRINSSSRGLANSGFSGVCDECGNTVRPDSRTSRSNLQSQGQRRHVPMTPSQQGSLRSSHSLGGISSASLRKEVQDAVQQEVAKVVQPLKEKLSCEKASRQRLEQMYRQAIGEKCT